MKTERKKGKSYTVCNCPKLKQENEDRKQRKDGWKTQTKAKIKKEGQQREKLDIKIEGKHRQKQR